MRLTLSLILVALALMPAYAQENPVPYFISIYNGRLALPFLLQRPENRQHVKTVTILQPYTHTENEVVMHDTPVVYKKWYAPNGDEVTIEQNSYSEFKGFKNIAFNKDGTIASKTFETQGMRGCGNYHWVVGGEVTYTYEYNKGKCTRVATRDGSYTEYVYNDGLKTAASSYYNTIDSGKKQLQKSEFSFRYRYDKKGRLTEEYQIDNYANKKADDIPGLPANMLTILLRQTPEYTNEYLVAEFGITEDSLYADRAELPEVFVKRIDYRDSIDYRTIERFKEMARYFTGYEYSSNGSLVKRYFFDGNELQQIETYTYDDKERLVKWDRLDDFYTRNQWADGNETLWTFAYNSNNQITHCERREYKREYQSDFGALKEKPALKLDETERYDFTYDAKGLMSEISSHLSNTYMTDSRNYIVRYDFF